MIPAKYTLLHEKIKTTIEAHDNARCLIWLDDDFDGDTSPFMDFKKSLVIIINRIDHITHLKSLNFDAHFCDFRLPDTIGEIHHVFYRVSKEKHVSHHILNCSELLLEQSRLNTKTDYIPTLSLLGRKEEGIKSYADKCIQSLGFSGKTKKYKNQYLSQLTKVAPKSTPLDTEDYHSIREIINTTIKGHTYTLYSKPGVYGWRKIDSGTAFLINTLEDSNDAFPLTHSDKPQDQLKALDLGCGAGLLTLALHAFGYPHITSTDNNAAAITACQYTCRKNKIEASVLADHCGDALTGTFDLILCNPPFHKSFSTNTDLSGEFVNACKRLLDKNGRAFFVCNAFVGIEKLFANVGLNTYIRANNKQFKVIEIAH